ncbi:MAG TPA: hypothetical protein DCK81_05670, partial [Clostridiales bacterium UBA9856]|nr:hypothetical protein [Clostridiales bacterium UBA9856]
MLETKSALRRYWGRKDFLPQFRLSTNRMKSRHAEKRVQLVKSGEADLLMKGLVNSSVFLRAVLKEEKEGSGQVFLNHLASFQVPGFNRLLFFSDGGMNIAPGV